MIDIRRMYQFTDENLGVEHQYMGAYRPQETAQLEDQPTVFPGTMDEGINVDGVEMTVEVQGQSVTYTITGLPTGDDIFDYRVSFAANHASELDRYTNSVTIGERTARATVTRPGATPPNQARAEY